MKLFIYEHITSGALIDAPLPASLAREGHEMLMAIVQDFSQIANIELFILRDHRLTALTQISHVSSYPVTNANTFQHHYHDLLNHVDVVLPIAPETEHVLYDIQSDVLNSPAHLLGCQPAATEVCTNKLHYGQRFNRSTPMTVKAKDFLASPFSSRTGFIIKPLDGAGCLDTLFCAQASDVSLFLQQHIDSLERLIVQDYREGTPISLCLLADISGITVLSINQQHIDINHQNGTLSYQGSTVNGVDDAIFSLQQAQKLAADIHKNIPGLFGFIGADLIVGEDKISIIDINPRLTTSYSALHQSLKINPAQLLLTLFKHGLSALPAFTTRTPIEVLI